MTHRCEFCRGHATDEPDPAQVVWAFPTPTATMGRVWHLCGPCAERRQRDPVWAVQVRDALGEDVSMAFGDPAETRIRLD